MRQNSPPAVPCIISQLYLCLASDIPTTRLPKPQILDPYPSSSGHNKKGFYRQAPYPDNRGMAQRRSPSPETSIKL